MAQSSIAKGQSQPFILSPPTATMSHPRPEATGFLTGQLAAFTAAEHIDPSSKGPFTMVEETPHILAEIEIDATPQEVWDVLMDYDRLPDWSNGFLEPDLKLIE